MKAKINGVNWEVINDPSGMSYDGVAIKWDYNFNSKRFMFDVSSLVNMPSSGKRDMIYIHFNFTPKIGKYYLNTSSDSIVTASIQGTNSDGNYINYSSSGYIDVIAFSKESMSGNFEFHAKNNYVQKPESEITEGSFFAPIVGGTNGSWTGPN
jgi:hypothetical protein